MTQKFFTKSAFKVALTCPTQLYYSRNKEYTNQSDTDEFLQALAEGGFQVGELAKVYYGISGPNDIKSLDYTESLRQTKALFDGSDNGNIAESAFLFRNCFVRVDILETLPTSGTMISGNTLTPSLVSSHAASMMALVCISVISGRVMPSLHPLRPSIGFIS